MLSEVTKQLSLNGGEGVSTDVHEKLPVWKRPERGRSRQPYKRRFEGQVIAVITQQYIRLSPEAGDTLGCSHVAVWNRQDAWGFKPAKPDDPDAYPLKKEQARKDKKESGNWMIYCADFIKAEKLPNGYYFAGAITHDYALRFEKLPTGKV